MVLQTNELYSSTTRGPLPRIQPQEGPGSVVVKVFAAGTALLPVGFPVCVVPTTGLLDECDPDSANAWEQVVEGFVYPAPVQLVAGGEVHGTVMIKGMIHYEEVLAHLTQLTGTAQQLKDMLRKPGVRNADLHIEGLDKLGGNAGLA